MANHIQISTADNEAHNGEVPVVVVMSELVGEPSPTQERKKGNEVIMGFRFIAPLISGNKSN